MPIHVITQKQCGLEPVLEDNSPTYEAIIFLGQQGTCQAMGPSPGWEVQQNISYPMANAAAAAARLSQKVKDGGSFS